MRHPIECAYFSVLSHPVNDFPAALPVKCTIRRHDASADAQGAVLMRYKDVDLLRLYIGIYRYLRIDNETGYRHVRNTPFPIRLFLHLNSNDLALFNNDFCSQPGTV
jgi:hypothetical protein